METPGPVVIDFRVVKESNVYPMIPSGQTIDEMVISRPVDPAEEPSSACHFTPGQTGETADVEDTRLPKPGEVVDVAR
jgi:hypothetical protein